MMKRCYTTVIACLHLVGLFNVPSREAIAGVEVDASLATYMRTGGVSGSLDSIGSDNQQLSAGILSATTRAVEIGVIAPFPCHWCVCSADIGHPCTGGTALPLANCDPPILCGGVTLGVVTENLTSSSPTTSEFDMNGDGAVDAADLIEMIEESAQKKTLNANQIHRRPFP